METPGARALLQHGAQPQRRPPGPGPGPGPGEAPEGEAEGTRSSPLHLAAGGGHASCVHELLKHGAAKGRGGRQDARRACAFAAHSCHLAVVQRLLQHDASLIFAIPHAMLRHICDELESRGGERAAAASSSSSSSSTAPPPAADGGPGTPTAAAAGERRQGRRQGRGREHRDDDGAWASEPTQLRACYRRLRARLSVLDQFEAAARAGQWTELRQLIGAAHSMDLTSRPRPCDDSDFRLPTSQPACCADPRTYQYLWQGTRCSAHSPPRCCRPALAAAWGGGASCGRSWMCASPRAARRSRTP
jgi:hypothetical protein